MASEIERACKIDGYMDPPDLLWLAQQAKTHSCIVELGSYLGRSTRALGDNAIGKVYAVDNWKGPVGLQGENFDPSPDQFGRFCTNVADLIADGKVVPVKSEHRKAKVPEAPDMVFIDGDHSVEAVKRDIKKWLPKLRKGGLICGHDAMWPGLIEAVWDELGYVELSATTQIWWKVV